MTPVERLQAAIEKLEALKAESSPGPWEAVKGEYFYEHSPVHLYHARVRPNDPDYDRDLIHAAAWAEDYSGPLEHDAELIVTLHRTIDAQLAILRYAVTLEATVQPPADWRARATALADAILGGDS